MENKSADPKSDLNKLAVQVLEKYDIKPQTISVIQGGSIKTVWKIKTANNYVCLKRLKQTYDKALFSVNAQIYIKNNKGNVPGIIPDKAGDPVVSYNEQLFVVYEWLDGKDLDFNNNSDLKLAIQGLAKFHIASKGYIPPADARISSKLDKWPEQYSSMKSKLTAWREESLNKKSLSNFASYINSVDPIIDICNSAIKLIENSAYKSLVSSNSPSVVLCHQDYGKGNALLTDQGVDVLDLDGVTYDLPARDLRKLIGKQAENKNRWDVDNILKIVDWYTSVNPMTQKEKKVLYIDMLFPHWFYGLVKNQFLNQKNLKASEIERIAKLEQSKVPVLNSLLSGGE